MLRRGPAPEAADYALGTLTDDHAAAKQLFARYEDLVDDSSNPGSRADIADRICVALTMHLLIEEDIFYPALYARLADSELMDKMALEHTRLRERVMDLQGMQPDDPDYDATVIVLGKNFDAHVAREERDLFPKARQAGIDLVQLGEKIRRRKAEFARLPDSSDLF